MRRQILILLTVLLQSSLFAQSGNDSIALRALLRGRIMQQERVYVLFDNSSYYLGETMWFKAFVTIGTEDAASTLSRVLYVELVAPEGYVVKTEKYKIGSDGYCNGEIYLDPLYLSGYYEIRAYTRYMLNWGDEAIFSRVFPVFDKVNGNNWSFKNILSRERGFAINGRWIAPDTKECDLKFYPEGGHLVNGIETRVAYEITGKGERKSKDTLTIYADDKILLQTTPAHYGKGDFKFTPQINTKYKAVVKKSDNRTFTYHLPKIFEKGGSIKVTEFKDSVKFLISRNCAEEVGFAIVHRGAIAHYCNIKDKKKSIVIALKDMCEGVSRAVVFCGETPLAERMFFVEHNNLQKGDRETVRLNIKADGKELHRLKAEPHKKITLTIEREDGRPIADTAHLALSITDNAGTTATSWGYNMYSYLLLGSEVRGYIPNAEQYFDPDNKKRKEHLDLVMLTNGWTAYDWEKLTKKKINDIQPVEKGILIKGKLYLRHSHKFKNTNKRLQEQTFHLSRFDISYTADTIKTTSFRSDSVGGFILQTEDFYGERIAMLTPETKIKNNKNISYRYVLDRYFSPKFRLYDYWEKNIGSSIREEENSLLKVSLFENLLSPIEVVAKKKKEINSRPPHSEIRFNYLDEWEYAQDITYLNKNSTEENLLNKERDFNDYYQTQNEETESSFFESVDNAIFSRIEDIKTLERKSTKDYSFQPTREKYIGYHNMGGGSIFFTTEEEYLHTMSAEDVVKSAMLRHNYNWAYWVFLMVVKGEYSSTTTPTPDYDYLKGTPNVEKMTTFKEIVIRSDENTRKQFVNSNNFWSGKSRALSNKMINQRFYMGFLTQTYIYNKKGIDNCPDANTFATNILYGRGSGLWEPRHPNYVACLIPYEKEKNTFNGIIPELYTGGTARYTRLQGYSKSKQFYSPDYSNTTPTQEDHRRTLLWDPAPKAKNGKIEIEFYNSTTCEAINVNIEGRGGNTFYGNNKNIKTKTHDGEERKKRTKNIKVRYADPTMDSTLMAQCEAEFAKAEIYYSQKRYSKSLTPYIELAQLGYAPAIHRIAQCYLHGRALKRKETLAYDFMLKAAEKEHEEAQFELAMMLRDGTGTKPDTIEAIKWLEKAAERKEPNALCELGKLLLTEGDTARGAKALQEATTLKHPEAMFRYGIFLIETGVEKDSLTGTPLHCIEEAANLKNPDALIYMMNLRDKENNITQAYKHARELQLQGVHEGIKFIADCYFAGRGVRRDKKLAKDLYRDAAKAGNKEAKKILKEW